MQSTRSVYFPNRVMENCQILEKCINLEKENGANVLCRVTKLCTKAADIYWFSVARRHHSIPYFCLGFYIFGKSLHPCFHNIQRRDMSPQIFTASTLLTSIPTQFYYRFRRFTAE